MEESTTQGLVIRYKAGSSRDRGQPITAATPLHATRSLALSLSLFLLLQPCQASLISWPLQHASAGEFPLQRLAAQGLYLVHRMDTKCPGYGSVVHGLGLSALVGKLLLIYVLLAKESSLAGW
jgi:hypothetical protein